MLTLLMVFSINSFAQMTVKPGWDTVIIAVCNTFKVLDNGYAVYNVSIANYSNKPACILHTLAIELSPLLPPQLLALAYDKTGTEFFTLNYGAGDTVYSHPLKAYMGSIILTLQKLQFEVAIPPTQLPREFEVEFFHLTDFSYNALVAEISEDHDKWYLKYQRKRIRTIIGK